MSLYPNCDVNVWLRSCDSEVLEPIEGTITGYIPPWLTGSFIRNGPGSIRVGSDSFEHLFDASAHLHRFCIKNGKVTYQCRFLQSEVYKKNVQANRIVLTEFGTKAVPDPCKTIFSSISSIFNPKSDNVSDNSMISVYPFGDEMYAFGEIPIIHKVDKISLETKGRVNVSDFVSIVHHTSHPHVTKEGVFNMGLSVYPTGPHHTIVKFPSKLEFSKDSSNMFKDASIVASIPARWRFHPSYMHTFGLTDNFFIIVEQPLCVSVERMIATKLTNGPLASCFKWYQHEKTKINLISRSSGALAYTFFTEAFFFLHIINQYEEDNYVIIDICTYKNPDMLECMYIENMKNMQQNPNYAEMFRSKPLRFVLSLKSNETLIKPERICDLGCETPRINYDRYLGKKYRFFYAISADVDADNPGTIIKVDTVFKTTKTWCENNCYPSEPVFVPRPQSHFEDDGLILSALVWGGKETNKVGLLLLDAISFKEIGRAVFDTVGPVPKCLHGWFFPQTQ